MVDRVRVVTWLTVGGVVAFVAVGAGLNALDVEVPLYLSLPSALTLFGLMFRAYDEFLWRFKILGRWPASAIPDLRGRWEGAIAIRGGPVRSEEGTPLIPCTVMIAQSWSRISIEFETQFTHSSSSMASIAGQGMRYGLRYEYVVTPKPGSELEGMAPHAGMARLRPVDGCWHDLEGDWFNDQNYHRHGTYSLRRVGAA